MEVEVKIDGWVMTPGDGELKLVRRDELELILPLEEGEDPMDLALCDAVKLVRHIEDMLANGRFKAMKEIGERPVWLELKREDGRWKFWARGAARFDMWLSCQEALLMSLALDLMEWSLSKKALASIIKDRLEGEALFKMERGSIIRLTVEEKCFYLAIEEPGQKSEMTLFKRVAEHLGREERVPISDELGVGLFLCQADDYDVVRELAPKVRRHLVRMAFKDRLNEMEIKEDEVIVKNSYGTWTIDLRTGSLRLNDFFICKNTRSRLRAPSLAVLPGLGPVKLDEGTEEVLNAIRIALEPDKVEDEDVAKQIKEIVEGVRQELGEVDIEDVLRSLHWRPGLACMLTRVRRELLRALIEQMGGP